MAERDESQFCRACEAGPHTCGLPQYDDAIRNSIERWIKAAGERAERDTPAAEMNVHYRDGMERVYRAIWPEREVRRG